MLGVYAFIVQQNTPITRQVLTQEEYHQEVFLLVENYSLGSESAQSVYNSLLALHIPESEKDVHLELVLLFGKVLAGEIDSADNGITELRSTHDWLLEPNE